MKKTAKYFMQTSCTYYILITIHIITYTPIITNTFKKNCACFQRYIKLLNILLSKGVKFLFSSENYPDSLETNAGIPLPDSRKFPILEHSLSGNTIIFNLDLLCISIYLSDSGEEKVSCSSDQKT